MSPALSIGIDLGTTNCAVGVADLRSLKAECRIQPLEQLIAPDQTAEQLLLPSALYFPLETEKSHRRTGGWLEPAPGTVLAAGAFAREQAGRLPGRVVLSAKSWLCHSGINRDAKILPWASNEIGEDQKLSPVEASSLLLLHIRHDLERLVLAPRGLSLDMQHICITVPASFDEAAQLLTRRAAILAGFPETVRLLEEPQASFYHWLTGHRDRADFTAAIGGEEKKRVLVVDVGGGTTDFSLFDVLWPLEAPLPVSERIAVSDHILLGGDNMDHAVARLLAERIPEGGKLSRQEYQTLLFESRILKEKTFGEEGAPDASFSVSVSSGGARLFATARTVTVSRREIGALLVDGFFPRCAADAVAAHRTSALQEFGLPYAADSAITRHLASFLAGRPVDALLCNGGALKPASLQQRLLETLQSWQETRPLALQSPDMDLSVALGAAFHGVARSRKALPSIKAGYAHSLYLRVRAAEGTDRFVCILERGTEPGMSVALEELTFKLTLNKPAVFQIYFCATRQDRAGDILETADDLRMLPPLETAVAAEAITARDIEVKLETGISETGLLTMALKASDGRVFSLSFNVRKGSIEAEPAVATAAEQRGTPAFGVPPAAVTAALTRIESYYGKARSAEAARSPKALMAELEADLNLPRERWSTSLLRALWTPLARGITRRGRSLQHEVSWLYAAGYVLRPGYGDAMDRFRMAEAFRLTELGLSFPREKMVRTNWWLLWRRIAGGLTGPMQEALFVDALPRLDRKEEVSPELLRMFGSLERIQTAQKIELGKRLLKFVQEKRVYVEHALWALSRAGSRQPVNAGAEHVVPPVVVGEWLRTLIALDWRQNEYRSMSAVAAELACCTHVPELNIEEDLRRQVLHKMRQNRAGEQLIAKAEHFIQPDRTSVEEELLGEKLPPGLALIAG